MWEQQVDGCITQYIWQVNFDIGILNSADPRDRKKIQVGQAPLEL